MGPVPHIGMYIERRIVPGGILNGGSTESPGKLRSSSSIQYESVLVDVLPARAAFAQSVDSPVGAVGPSALQQEVLSTIVALGQADRTARRQRMESYANMAAYNAKRAEATPEVPLGHTTVKGFHTIWPPQAKPAHAVPIGAVTLMTASYGSLVVFGRATPKVNPDAAFVYDE